MSSLPAIVRRYAKENGPDDPQTARTVRIHQEGDMAFRPGAAPRRFTAVEELATDRVAFAWRARFPLLGPISLRVTDSYERDDGALTLRALGLPIQRKRGPQLAQGQAFRYLAELPWVPQAIVLNPQLTWAGIDRRTVEVAKHAGGSRVAVRLHFNEMAEIEQIFAQRPRLEAEGEITPWIGIYHDYRTLEGWRIPTRAEVRWELPSGPFTYWRGAVKSFEISDAQLRVDPRGASNSG